MRLVAVILPDLGTGAATPVTVSYWYAARGEAVWEGDRLVEVLAGPATFDVSSPATGRLADIRLREDDQAVPGALLGQIAVLDEDAHGDVGGGSDRGRDQGHGPRPSSQRPQ
jgi:pyruvate/2-oxoglutarate dehydrogenase complex dihydrolipoamide acyltransferase (E2) component